MKSPARSKTRTRIAVFFAVSSLFIYAHGALAATCGGATSCNCGDTVVASTTFANGTNLVCASNGLIVGANNITIDGAGGTISGNGSSGNGISDSGYSGVTVKNFSSITGFGYGVSFQNATDSTLYNITADGNSTAGIYFVSSGSSTISSSTANNNFNNASSPGYGIYLSGSATSTLSDNTANGNEYGIYLDDAGGSVTMTGNSMSGNYNHNPSDSTGDLFINGVFTNSSYNNLIDATNLVEGKPVYYLYKQSDQVYDGDSLPGGVGMFWCLSCTNVTLENAVLSPRNYAAVFFSSTTGSVINNVTANGSFYDINISNSPGITLTNSTADSSIDIGVYVVYSPDSRISGTTASINPQGVLVANSATSTLSGNTINSNEYGVRLASSAGSTVVDNAISQNDAIGLGITSSPSSLISGNTLFTNVNDLSDDYPNNTHSGNQILYSASSSMISSAAGMETTRFKNVGDTVDFDISTFTPLHVACSNGGSPNCTHDIFTSPSEDITIDSAVGNDIQGHFTVTHPGTYSLNAVVTDANGNVGKRSWFYFVGPVATTTTRYYLRGTFPTHGQPHGNQHDSGSLSLVPPSSLETRYCYQWVQASPDAIPAYPFSSLSGVNVDQQYKLLTGNAYLGVQRFVYYDLNVDASSTLPDESNYTQSQTALNNLNWAMDTPQNWYDTSLKLGSDVFVVTSNAFWQFDPANPSYADYSYQYATEPAIQSISNPSILVMSATAASTTATTSVTVVLSNPLASATSTSLTFTGLPYAFTGGTSLIGADGTSTVTATLAGSATTSLATVALDVAPSYGTVVVTLSTWNTSGDYSKSWTETGSDHSIVTTHTVGDLLPDTKYDLTVNGSLASTYTSDASGTIAFVYSGGYSTDTFSITPDVGTAPSSNPPVSYSSSGGSGGGGSGSSVSPAVLDALLSSSTAPIPDSCATTGSALPPVAFTLSIGSRGADVTNLQTFLVMGGYLGAQYITGYFGPLTKAALDSYLTDHPATLSCAATATGTASASSTASLPLFARTLRSGSRGADVQDLQIFLNAHGDAVAPSGPGSPGQETMYYGSATAAAVSKFQMDHAADILTPDGLTEGTGFFGPATMKVANSLIAAGM